MRSIKHEFCSFEIGNISRSLRLSPSDSSWRVVTCCCQHCPDHPAVSRVRTSWGTGTGRGEGRHHHHEVWSSLLTWGQYFSVTSSRREEKFKTKQNITEILHCGKCPEEEGFDMNALTWYVMLVRVIWLISKTSSVFSIWILGEYLELLLRHLSEVWRSFSFVKILFKFMLIRARALLSRIVWY